MPKADNGLSLNFKGLSNGYGFEGIVRLTRMARPKLTGICVPFESRAADALTFDSGAYFFYGNRADLQTIGRSFTHIEQFSQLGLVDKRAGELEEEWLNIPNRLLFTSNGLISKNSLADGGVGAHVDLVWQGLISLGFLAEENGAGIIQQTINTNPLSIIPEIEGIPPQICGLALQILRNTVPFSSVNTRNAVSNMITRAEDGTGALLNNMREVCITGGRGRSANNLSVFPQYLMGMAMETGTYLSSTCRIEWSDSLPGAAGQGARLTMPNRRRGLDDSHD